MVLITGAVSLLELRDTGVSSENPWGRSTANSFGGEVL